MNPFLGTVKKFTNIQIYSTVSESYSERDPPGLESDA